MKKKTESTVAMTLDLTRAQWTLLHAALQREQARVAQDRHITGAWFDGAKITAILKQIEAQACRQPAV